MVLEEFAKALAGGDVTERGGPIRSGRRHRLWRAVTGVDSYEVAIILGVSHGTLMRYERGMRHPTPEHKEKLLERYGFRW